MQEPEVLFYFMLGLEDKPNIMDIMVLMDKKTKFRN